MTEIKPGTRGYFQADASDPVLVAKFWQKVDRRSDGECWPWTGSIRQSGYGAFSVGRRAMPAHRFAFLTANELNPTLVIDHLCRNRACCNPLHLRAVTNAENVLSGIGPTARNARKVSCPRGHPLKGDNLAGRSDGFRECRACRNAMQNERRRRAREAKASLEAASKAAIDALEWLGAQKRLSLEFYSPVYCDDDDQAREWRAAITRGSINDREWEVVGRGETPSAALIDARATLANLDTLLSEGGQ